MDESAYRQALTEIDAGHCVFSKAVLAQCVACPCSRKLQIAEREVIGCNEADSQVACSALHRALRQAFSFALGQIHDDAVLTHAQEMRVQCGGLKGLGHVLQQRSEIADVAALLRSALATYGDWGSLPYSEVVHAAKICYKGRRG